MKAFTFILVTILGYSSALSPTLPWIGSPEQAAKAALAAAKPVPACTVGVKSETVKVVNGIPLVETTCPLTDEMVAQLVAYQKREAEEQSLSNEMASGALEARQTTFCGQRCSTGCAQGTGGPNPNDCSVIADYVQRSGPTAYIPRNSTTTWTYSSCRTGVWNAGSNNYSMCTDNNNLSGTWRYLAWNCQASSAGGPFRGGNCYYSSTLFAFAAHY